MAVSFKINHLFNVTQVFFLLRILIARFKYLNKQKKELKDYKEKLEETYLGIEEVADDKCSTEKLLKNKFQVFVNVTVERKKPKMGRYIPKEYMEKLMMYGYVMVRFLF